MKRVRYAVGAAALAPVAIGTALPATAHAATVSPKVKTKSVVLEGTAVTPALLGCTASVPVSESSTGSLMTRFDGYEGIYLAGDVCIGTLYVNRHFLNNNCVNITFHVIYKGGTSQYTAKVCGQKGGTASVQHTFRKEYPAAPDGAGNWVDISVTSPYGQLGMGISSHGTVVGGRVT